MTLRAALLATLWLMTGCAQAGESRQSSGDMPPQDAGSAQTADGTAALAEPRLPSVTDAGVAPAGDAGPGNEDGLPDTGENNAEIPPTAGDEDNDAETALPIDCSLPADNRCEMPTALGEISGDETPEMNWLEHADSGARWLSVRVREDHSGDRKLRFFADLDSSPEADYDLRVHMGDSPDALQCERYNWESLKPAGQTEHIEGEWDYENVFGNGDDDGRTLTIEVFHVAGPCAPWTLRVEGRR